MNPLPDNDLEMLDDIFSRLADTGYASTRLDEISERLMKAGLIKKQTSDDSTGKIISQLTEPGERIVSLFKYLNAKLAPLSRVDIVLLWIFLTKNQEPFAAPPPPGSS